ncbi:hypothetical protein AA309_28770 [Microvirga vignae]|uniref:Transposase n=1 Tax=Microvirga vignae TaxID=1225564 RepID=A0A0H1R3X6_9HYPH|nr:hypothetical protein AA309_28770 [Microvirga vignae]
MALVRQAKKCGLALRQTHTCLAKRAAVQVGRYAHARQMRRMGRELRRLKTYLGRVYRDVSRKVAGDEVLSRWFAPLLGLTERMLVQERTSQNKLYGLHAPEVCAPPKGKHTVRVRRQSGCGGDQPGRLCAHVQGAGGQSV